GATVHTLNETDADFSPDQLKLQSARILANDVTVVGQIEPRAYVKDYFMGDGFSLRLDLSQPPFTRIPRVLLDEEYAALRATRWVLVDPGSAISVSGGKLQVSGGTGLDGQTKMSFVEKVELGGALVMQHGDVSFTAASDGVLGRL